METKALKSQMAVLWKNTFADSDEYVNIVFDNYFNPDLVAFREVNGMVISALMGIPYEFRSGDPDVGSLKGLYLCGLSTVTSHRNQGLMSILLEEINAKARKYGFDFTFLIPASPGLSRYYENRGYMPAFFFEEQNYVADHDFESVFRKMCLKKNDYPKIENFEKLEVMEVNFKISETGELESDSAITPESLVSFLADCPVNLIESKDVKSLSIFHRDDDWRLVIKESIISSDHIFLCMEGDTIKGTAFTTFTDSRIRIKKIISVNEETDIKLKDYIKKFYPTSSMTVVCYENEQKFDFHQDQIWKPFYLHNNSPQAEYEDMSSVETSVLSQNCTKPFGMCRILNASEILKKITNCQDDREFSILANEEKFMLRRPSNPDYVGEAMNIPLLNLSAFLLLE